MMQNAVNNPYKIFNDRGGFMPKFYYVVNTFDKNFIPIQRRGYVEAVGEQKAIEKLISDGVAHERGYEFLVFDYEMPEDACPCESCEYGWSYVSSDEGYCSCEETCLKLHQYWKNNNTIK